VGLGRRSVLHEGTATAKPANAVVDGCQKSFAKACGKKVGGNGAQQSGPL
jgi:hypothetical protein